MHYTVVVTLTDDAEKLHVVTFDSSEYADPRNCILDAQVWINKKLLYDPMDPKDFRDYSKRRHPCTNWKHEDAGAGEG